MQSQEIRAIDTELDGFKREITKAQEQNEQLTYMHHRIEGDIANVKKQIVVCQNKQEALKIEYGTYSRTLRETEQFLSKAYTVSRHRVPVNIFLFKVNSGNTRNTCEIYSKLIIMIPERRHCLSLSVVLVSVLLTLNMFHTFS